MKKGPVAANQSLGSVSACPAPLLGIDVNIYSQDFCPAYRYVQTAWVSQKPE